MAKISIPSVSSQLAPDMRAFVQRVREAFTVFGTAIVTKEELERAGVIGVSPGGDVVPPPWGPGDTKPDFTPPPAPTGFTAVGAVETIILEWDTPTHRNHGHAEIWRATVNDLGQAVKYGTTMGDLYADANITPNVEYFYWLRYVTNTEPPVYGPYNSTVGTSAIAGPDPAVLLDALTNQLTKDQLVQSLRDEITGYGTQIGDLQAQVSELSGTPDYDPTHTYQLDEIVKYNGGLYRALGTTTGNLPTDATYWQKIGDYASLGDAVAAHGVTLNDHEIRIGDTEDGITSEVAARQGLATAITGFADPAGKTLAQLASGLIYQEKTARVSAVSAVAQDVSILSSTVGGHTTTIEQHTSSIDGIEGKITVKIDNNGFITGYGLISSANNGTPTSEFAIVADKFTIAPVATSPAADGSPFFHLTVATTIEGTLVPAGTYMKSAYLHKASIGTLQLKEGAVDTLRIANEAVVESKIGNLAVTNAKIGNFIQSNNYVPGSSGWHINKDGTCEFANAVIRGGVWAGNITSNAGVTVGATGSIKGGATAFGAGTGFWMGYDNGYYKMRVGSTTLCFQYDGSKVVMGNPSGGRVEATSSGLTVYTDSNQVALSSGSGVQYNQINGRPTSLASINAAEAKELSQVSQRRLNLLSNSAFLGTGQYPVGWAEYNNAGVAKTAWIGQREGLFGSNLMYFRPDAPTGSNFGLYTNISLGGGVRHYPGWGWAPGWGYIVSFYAIAPASQPGAAGKQMYGLYSNMNFDYIQEISNPPLLAGVWQRYEFFGVARNNSFAASGELYISWKVDGILPAGALIAVCCPQVEIGSGSATRWEVSVYDTPGLGNPITASNITTFMDNAAIGSAQIGSAQIGTGHIQIAAVDTLLLAGNAVTVPVVTNSAGTGPSTIQVVSRTTEIVLATFSTNPYGRGTVTLFITPDSGSLVARAETVVKPNDGTTILNFRIQLLRNGVVIKEVAHTTGYVLSGSLTANWTVIHDTPGPGVYCVYSIRIISYSVYDYYHTHTVPPVSVLLLETAR